MLIYVCMSLYPFIFCDNNRLFSMNTTRLLIIIVFILILMIYIQYYSKFNKDNEIVQTFLDKITLNLLYERNPIVIYDSIKTPKQLLGTLFKYSYLTKKEYVINHKYPTISRAKFSFIYSIENTYVNLINPTFKSSMKWIKNSQGEKVSTQKLEETNVEYMTLKLKPYQVVIIPSHWIIQCETPLNKVDLDDLLSRIYFTFM